jgi:hypothetical protein
LYVVSRKLKLGGTGETLLYGHIPKATKMQNHVKPVKVLKAVKVAEFETTLRRKKECLCKYLIFHGIPSDSALIRLKEACEDLLQTIQELQTLPNPKQNGKGGPSPSSVWMTGTGQTPKPGSHQS